MAVDRVICEPCSAPGSPVFRENTGKFSNFRELKCLFAHVKQAVSELRAISSKNNREKQGTPKMQEQ